MSYRVCLTDFEKHCLRSLYNARYADEKNPEKHEFCNIKMHELSMLLGHNVSWPQLQWEEQQAASQQAHRHQQEAWVQQQHDWVQQQEEHEWVQQQMAERQREQEWVQQQLESQQQEWVQQQLQQQAAAWAQQQQQQQGSPSTQLDFGSAPIPAREQGCKPQQPKTGMV